MTVVDGLTLPELDEDGKQFVIQTPRLKGLNTWFHGAGDQLDPLVRGRGQKLHVALAGEDEATVEIQYGEPMWLHDGGVLWDQVNNWSPGDNFEMYLRIPATTVTPNGGGTGNCNVVDGIIIPAAGDGGFDVVLADAVPVPVEDDEAPNGFWDVDEYADDAPVTVSATPGTAKYHLVAAEQKAYLMRSMPLAQPGP